MSPRVSSAPGEPIAALAAARMAEAIVPAIEPDDRYPGIARREATDVAASRCRQPDRAAWGRSTYKAIAGGPVALRRSLHLSASVRGERRPGHPRGSFTHGVAAGLATCSPRAIKISTAGPAREPASASTAVPIGWRPTRWDATGTVFVCRSLGAGEHCIGTRASREGA
jgi:hypothetical protein